MLRIRPYIIISGFNLNDNNRGTAALGYGSVSFLQEKGLLQEGQTLLSIRSFNNVLKPVFWKKNQNTLDFNGTSWKFKTIYIHNIFLWLYFRFGILLPFTTLWYYIKKISLVAAINGGDGFSDIYNTKTFFGRLLETKIAMKAGIPLIILPQTLGPFKEKENYAIAEKILKYADKVYVRDNKFTEELQKMGVDFEETKDLSYYMKPEPWDIEILPNAVGINVSGLAYSNGFRTLAGKFDHYPELIGKLIETFQKKAVPVYLIPHSYNYTHPEVNNDDIVACREAYNRLAEKQNVFLIDKDLISPQVKYVISRMTFFVGTRMHANFAAIYTGVPVFGLSYSYKFKGAFEANGIFDSTASVIDMKEDDVEPIISRIITKYENTNLPIR